jgi:hypothetical protein
LRKLRQLVKAIRRNSELLRQVPEKQSAFIRVHNETLSVAVRVNNPDRSPLKIQS